MTTDVRTDVMVTTQWVVEHAKDTGVRLVEVDVDTAAYAFWVLQLYGHERLAIMDGGRKKWIDEGRPLTKDTPAYPPATYRTKEPSAALRAMRELVRESLGRGDRALVDVRSPAEYNGEIMAPPGLQETAQRMG